MEINLSTEFTVGNLIELKREQILRVNHEYQRGLRWTSLQKRMFIDSILRGYSIPAFYFHKKETAAGTIRNTYYDIVDGQQRVDAIFTYSEDGFDLTDPNTDAGFHFPEFVRAADCPWAGKRFVDLSSELQERLSTHQVVVYEITTSNENEVRDLFIRLQGGTPLTPQDKRDSWPGKFTEYVLRVGGKTGVDRWFGDAFFKEVPKSNNESRRRQLVAQVFMLFWMNRTEAKFYDINSSKIDEFYHAHVGFDAKSEHPRQFEKICKVLYGAFRDRPKIVGHYIIHLVLLADALMIDYVPGWEVDLARKLQSFDDNRRRAVEAFRKDRTTDSFYSEYGALTQTRSDYAGTIRRRHVFFTQKMMGLLQPKKRDPKRTFSELERRTVYFRDRELCQWCKMFDRDHRVIWQDCEVHHVDRHVNGGATVLSNGALMHRDCHPKSEDDCVEFAGWWNDLPNPESQGSERTQWRRSRQLPPNDTRLKFEFKGTVHWATVRGGRIHLDNLDEDVGTFSAASGRITGTARNGWRDWYVNLPGESDWVLADEWALILS